MNIKLSQCEIDSLCIKLRMDVLTNVWAVFNTGFSIMAGYCDGKNCQHVNLFETPSNDFIVREGVSKIRMQVIGHDMKGVGFIPYSTWKRPVVRSPFLMKFGAYSGRNIWIGRSTLVLLLADQSDWVYDYLPIRFWK